MTIQSIVTDIERELGVAILGNETEEEDFEEKPYSDGDNVHYVTRNVLPRHAATCLR